MTANRYAPITAERPSPGPAAARTDPVPAARHTLDADEIRQQLARIVASKAFRNSLRLKRFITFVVEATLGGRSDRIKAYTIAMEALGRGSNFDPQSDAIVRVEAGRLRQALTRYYTGEGRDDPLVIELPRGTYVPSFRRRGGRNVAGADAIASATQALYEWCPLLWSTVTTELACSAPSQRATCPLATQCGVDGG